VAGPPRIEVLVSWGWGVRRPDSRARDFVERSGESWAAFTRPGTNWRELKDFVLVYGEMSV